LSNLMGNKYINSAQDTASQLVVLLVGVVSTGRS